MYAGSGATSVRLVAVGDVMVTRAVGRGEGFIDPAIRHAIGGADIAFANLEAPLADRGYPADKTVCFRSPPHLAEDLAGAGFDIVTLANNHALDFGVDGLRQTMDTLRSAGVRVVGAGENLHEALSDRRLSRNGLTISFLGMATTLPPGFAAAGTRPGIAGIRVVSEFVVDPPAFDEQPGMAPFGEPHVLADDETDVVLRRLDDCCSPLGTAVSASGERAVLVERDQMAVGSRWAG